MNLNPLPPDFPTRIPGKFECAACGGDLNGKTYLCATCFWKVPTQDRAQLHQMHMRRQDVTSKLAKIVKGLKSLSAS